MTLMAIIVEGKQETPPHIIVTGWQPIAAHICKGRAPHAANTLRSFYTHAVVEQHMMHHEIFTGAVL